MSIVSFRRDNEAAERAESHEVAILRMVRVNCNLLMQPVDQAIGYITLIDQRICVGEENDAVCLG